MLRILIFLLLSFGFAQAQTNTVAVESLQEVREKMGIPPNDSLLNRTHAERYTLLSGFWVNGSMSKLDTVAVEQVFADIEQFAKERNDQDLVRELWHLRLHIRFVQGDAEKCVQLSEYGYKRAKESGQPWEVFLSSWWLGYQLLGTVDRVDVGLYLLTEASETLNNGYRHPLEYYLNYILGSNHYSYNDFNSAKKYFGRALVSGERDSVHDNDSRVFNTLGLVYRKMNLLDSSDIYLNKALTTSLGEGDTIMECIISGNLGENQYLRGNYDAAIVLLEKDASMAMQGAELGLASNALMLMADCYLAKGEPDKCWPLLEKGRDYAYRSGQYNRLKTLYPILAKWYALNGDATLSALYTDSTKFVMDSLERIQSQVRVVPTDKLYEMNRMEIESIDQKNKIKQRNMIVFALFLLLVIISLFFQLYRTRMKLNEQRLEGENSQLQTNLTVARQRLNDFLESLTESAADTGSLNTSTIITEEGWLNFKKLFDASFPGYLKRVLKRHPELTKGEHRLMCFLRLEMSNKEIAIMLGVGQNAVQQLQRRTRRKINVETSEELAQLAQTL
ncbi:transcriptional regulator [Flavobacteriales bacterium]|nr:transcriptional regulator [Flavobacteriales bacterium]